MRLESRRIVLREFRAEDHDAIVAMHQDARLRAHLVDDYPLHERVIAQAFIENLAPFYRQHEGLGVWHASVGGQFVGWFNLMPMTERPGEVEIGSRLVPAAWGGGLAIEGGELLLEHAFGTLGRACVWGVCHPGNRSAEAVLQGLGFSPVGRMPYDGVEALHYRIELNAWRESRNTPCRTRLRRALRRSKPVEAAEGAATV